jgi:hypothetical protein
MSNWVSLDAMAENEAKRNPPYFGSEVNNPDWTYADPAVTVIDGAPSPGELWLLADYDPLFYVGLMAKYGYTNNAWKAIQNAPPPIKPYIPPRPVPAYISGLDGTGAGDFDGKTAPEFTS